MIHRSFSHPRRAVAAAVLVLAGIVGWSAPASAQRLLSPIVEMQPGVRTIDAVSSEGTAGSASGFNLRISATIPTTWRSIDLFVAADLTPFGLNNDRDAENDPALLYGVRLPVLMPRQTGGWLTVQLPVMGWYRYDPTGIESPRRRYVHDIMVEGAFTLHMGRKMLSDLGLFWSTVDAFLYIDQPVTKTVDPVTLKVDRFRPTFLYGLSVPIAGSRVDR